MRCLLLLAALVGCGLAFPSGMPFCVLRPEVQTTWAEQIGTTSIAFNQSCYNPGDELIVSLNSVRGHNFHGFVMRSDAGQFIRRHGFGGYRWIGEEANPDLSCITHVFPGAREENGKFLKTEVAAKLVVPNRGRLTPIRIIVESTAIKSFDDDVWSREWQSGVYSIARGTIEICPRAAAPRQENNRRPAVAALKLSKASGAAKRVNAAKPAGAKPIHSNSARKTAEPKRSRSGIKKSGIKFAPHKRCLLDDEAGRCPGVQDQAWRQEYYFDRSAGVCRKFFYAGCGGNANRFSNLASCERFCTGGEQPCAKVENKTCPIGTNYTWELAYYLNDETAQCVHYWYRSCADDDKPLFGDEKNCRRQCLGEIEPEGDDEPIRGPKGRCFELYDKDKEMCPVWASKKYCSPYPEDHENHWAHFNCRFSCCANHHL